MVAVPRATLLPTPGTRRLAGRCRPALCSGPAGAPGAVNGGLIGAPALAVTTCSHRAAVADGGAAAAGGALTDPGPAAAVAAGAPTAQAARAAWGQGGPMVRRTLVARVGFVP